MTQPEFNFNRPFYPDIPYLYGSQKRKMYDALKTCCSCTNTDFIRMGVFKYTGRISEIRRDLSAYGWTLRAESKGGGLTEYHLEKIYENKTPFMPIGKNKAAVRLGELV